MSGYTKLFASIVHSTIWREPNHIRLVWITMLALKDRDGIVEASIPGLADVARVSLEECEQALAKLMSPDKYSRTQDNEGRRIAECRGGWRVLNHDLYRDLESNEQRRNKDAARQRRHRSEKTKETHDHGEHVTICHDLSRLVTPSHARSRSVTTSDTDTDQIREDITVIAKDLTGGARVDSAFAAPEVTTAKITCPSDLRLTDAQRGALETSLIPGWAIDTLTAQYVSTQLADTTKTMPIVAWRKCLAKAVSGAWSNPRQRPTKPALEVPPRANGDDPGNPPNPGQVWHRDGYWYYPLPNAKSK